VALAHDGGTIRLVLDAGTGLRALTAVLDHKPFRGTIILTHLHWDHMMGLPFFRSGDHPDADVTLLAPEQGEPADVLLGRAMSPPLFPIRPDQLRGRWRFATYGEQCLELEGFTVVTREIPHKGGRTMGLRVGDHSGQVAYMPDHAPHLLGLGDRGVGVVHDAARQLATDVDVLFHDAQYTRLELADRFEWGHAAADYPVHLAEECSVKRVLLFHHDPDRTDDQVAMMHADLAASSSVAVDVAREGMVISI
jgi:phosphoribosyl 1,2-cyclic phosphodiesterase